MIGRGRLDHAAQQITVRGQQRVPWGILFAEARHREGILLGSCIHQRHCHASGRDACAECIDLHRTFPISPQAERLDDDPAAGAHFRCEQNFACGDAFEKDFDGVLRDGDVHRHGFAGAQAELPVHLFIAGFEAETHLAAYVAKQEVCAWCSGIYAIAEQTHPQGGEAVFDQSEVNLIHLHERRMPP